MWSEAIRRMNAEALRREAQWRTLALRNYVVASIRLRGSAVHCPCCGREFAAFLWSVHPNRRCPWCWSLERDRLLALYLEMDPTVVRPGIRVLHIAPERALRRRLRKQPDVEYVDGDLLGEFGRRRLDITDLAFPTDHFDLVVCNHVLEHVRDDRAAMAELRRVLKPTGRAILLVPDVEAETTDEDPTVVDEAERVRRFGQHDHVRRYGWDYVDRLTEAGFRVDVIDMSQHCSNEDIDRMRLAKLGAVEPLFICG